MKRQAKKATKGLKRRAPTILLIGGPVELSDSRVTRVPCDLAGIMTAPAFRDYPVVIYWPDESFASLPRTRKAWKDARSRNPSLPEIPAGYWANRRKPLPGEIFWDGAANEVEHATDSYKQQSLSPREALWSRLTAKIDHRGHAEEIDRFLRYTCLEKLMTLALGVQVGQTVVAVVAHHHRSAHAYAWISDNIRIYDRQDQQVHATDLDGSGLATTHGLVEAVGDAITEWPIVFQLGGMPDVASRSRWEGPWAEQMVSSFGDDDDFAAEFFSSANRPPSIDIEGRVLICAGHRAFDQAAKSLVFASGRGVLLLVPEPRSLQSLLQALKESNVAKGHDRRVLPMGASIRVASDGRSIYVDGALAIRLTADEGRWVGTCAELHATDGTEEFDLKNISLEAFGKASTRVSPSQIFRTHGSENFFRLFEQTGEPGVVTLRENVEFDKPDPKHIA